MSIPGAVATALGRRGRDGVVVGEVAQAHDGSLGTAHAYVDAIAAAGADAVKFQIHLPNAESTREEPWRVPFSRQDDSRYDYWARTGFTSDQWTGLGDHARDAGLALVCSPFSVEAVGVAKSMGVDAVKVASGEVASHDLLEAAASLSVPVLLSSGMSTYAELDAAVEVLRRSDAHLAILQCSSTYPCPPEEVGLNVMSEIRARYRCEVGLSDHSGTVYPSLAALTLGASVVEVHVTLSRESFGPDVTSSVTTAELATLCDGATWISTMARHPLDKDRAAAAREDVRVIFSRSLVARTALPAGHILSEGDLAAKKPGGGLPLGARESLVGGRLTRPLAADEQVQPTDVEMAAAPPRQPEP